MFQHPYLTGQDTPPLDASFFPSVPETTDFQALGEFREKQTNFSELPPAQRQFVVIVGMFSAFPQRRSYFSGLAQPLSGCPESSTLPTASTAPGALVTGGARRSEMEVFWEGEVPGRVLPPGGRWCGGSDRGGGVGAARRGRISGSRSAGVLAGDPFRRSRRALSTTEEGAPCPPPPPANGSRLV